MSLKLRDLIRAVRQCKTQQDERNVIASESAEIRTAFRDADGKHRHRNVAKLIFIHLLGYATHFGRVEIVNLCAQHKFAEKRVGYLALALLVDESHEELMLSTNTLKNDIASKNQFVVGLALATLGNIGSADMLRTLAPEVERRMTSSSAFVRKKATLCAVRLVRRVPDLADSFVERTCTLFNDSNHGVLLAAVTLAIAIAETAPDTIPTFRNSLGGDPSSTSGLVKMLRSLVLSGYTPDYEISGVADPFLQVKLLHMLRILGRGHKESSEVMSDVLASVATNTQLTGNKLSGMSVLYECVQTIMFIESDAHLRVMAVNILGKFLQHNDNNMRYVALNSLAKIATTELQALQRHRGVVVDCLRDQDISIRHRALELIYLLVNDSNIAPLTEELLGYLLVADSEFRMSICTNICLLAEKFAPSQEWLVDTYVNVLSTAGQYAREEIGFNMAGLVARSTPLQAYAVKRLYTALNENRTQPALAVVAVWAIGEYADLLVAPGGSASPAPSEVLDLLNDIAERHLFVSLRHITVAAATKLAARVPSIAAGAKRLIDQHKSDLSLEVQQRAVEYSAMFTHGADLRSLFERLAPSDEGDEDASPQQTHQPVQQTSMHQSQPSTSYTQPTAPTTTSPEVDLLGGPIQPQVKTTQDIVNQLLDPHATPAAVKAALQQTAPIAPKPSAVPLPLGGMPLVQPMPFVTPTPFVSQPSVPAGVLAYSKNGVSIYFKLERVPTHPTVTTINAAYVNANPYPVTAFELQTAVPKHVKLQINPPSGNTLPANSAGNVTQIIRLANEAQGQKKLAVRMKVVYVAEGEKVEDVADFKAFPEDA